MFAVSGDDHRVVQRRVFFNDGLHVADLRTGGVNNFNAAFLDFLSLAGCDAVRPDDQQGVLTIGDFIDALDGRNAPAFQEFNGLRVVDQGAVSVDLAAGFVLGNVQNRVHRPADAHAEPGCFGQFNFHVR